MYYEIVPMDRSHIEEIAALEKECFSTPWTEQMLTDALFDSQASFIVAEAEDGHILGYAGLHVIVDEGYIDNIAVTPDARRHGVASALLDVYCRFGAVNLHASLLPRYRGAGPIQWAVLNGETVTGVTTMYMAEGLDTGDMLESASLEIGPDETADELHDRLSQLGAKLLLSTVEKAEKGLLEPKKQDDALSCYAPMLTKELSRIDFSRPAQEVHNQIRGLSTWPAAYTCYQGKRLKVYRSHLVQGTGEPGTLLDSKHFVVACGEGAVQLTEVQYEGSRKMSGEDFLRGKKPGEHEVLG